MRQEIPSGQQEEIGVSSRLWRKGHSSRRRIHKGCGADYIHMLRCKSGLIHWASSGLCSEAVTAENWLLSEVGIMHKQPQLIQPAMQIERVAMLLDNARRWASSLGFCLQKSTVANSNFEGWQRCTSWSTMDRRKQERGFQIQVWIIFLDQL